MPALRLDPPAIVEGVVRDGAGRPLGGARVWLRDWDFALGHQRSGSMVEVFTDREGRYRFCGVPPGGAWLQLLVREDATSAGAAAPFEVAAGKTLRFDLQAQKE